MLRKMVRNAAGRNGTVFYLFGGKGGVGKTSMASATALWLSRKKKVLLISTDPAHSLSDSFEKRIGGDVKELKKNLYAVEIDTKKAMAEYREKLAPRIENIDMLKGLGLEDAFDMAGMTPGIDEISALSKFLEYMNSNEYDAIIFDTAPTGHTLRFLSLPDVLDSWLGKMIKIRMRFAGLASMVKKIIPFGEEEDKPSFGTEQLDEMKARIEKARKILSDPKRTHYNIVTIPEEMSILESDRAEQALREYGIPVDAVIINQLIPENSKCDFCREKRKIQLIRVRQIRKIFRGKRILEVEMFREEVKGIRMLERLGKALYGKA